MIVDRWEMEKYAHKYSRKSKSQVHLQHAAHKVTNAQLWSYINKHDTYGQSLCYMYYTLQRDLGCGCSAITTLIGYKNLLRERRCTYERKISNIVNCSCSAVKPNDTFSIGRWKEFNNLHKRSFLTVKSLDFSSGSNTIQQKGSLVCKQQIIPFPQNSNEIEGSEYILLLQVSSLHHIQHPHAMDYPYAYHCYLQDLPQKNLTLWKNYRSKSHDYHFLKMILLFQYVLQKYLSSFQGIVYIQHCAMCTCKTDNSTEL